jgi:hypothetical protein
MEVGALRPVLGLLSHTLTVHRLWWVGLAVGVGSVLFTLPLWRDYLTVLRNYTDAAPLSWAYLPMALIPVVAWRSGADAVHGKMRAAVYDGHVEVAGRRLVDHDLDVVGLGEAVERRA